MTTNMKRTFFTTLFLIIALTVTAQYFPVDTAKLNKAYMTLKQGICTEKTEMDFLEAFPTTWLEFYMTYSYINDENYDISMSQICSEHLITLLGLSHVNDTLLCKKVVNLTIGMKDNGECTSVYQDYLIGYIFKNEDLIINTLSKLRKGHQMEFWQFCWSSTCECNRAEHFNKIYNRNKDKYPEEMEISRIAYQHFYEGINYPNLLPHKEEEHNRKYYNRNYKYNFDDYTDSSDE